MVQLRGKGSMTGVNLLVKVYDNGVTKKGSHYADVSVDHRDPQAEGQTNLHLVSTKTVDDKTGVVSYNNSAPYSKAQFEALVGTAGPNTERHLNKAGDKELGSVFAVKADLMPASNGQGLVINTNKPILQSEFKVGPETLNEFHTAMTAAKTERDAKAAAAKEAAPVAPAPEAAPAEKVADANVPMFADTSVEADAPSFG